MAPFKTCTTCDTSWATREDLVFDEEMDITGYQPAATPDALGFVLITHDKPGCGSTLALDSGDLLDMYPRSIPDDVLYGSEACRGHCYRTADISTCDAPCRNAVIREVIKKILAEKRRRRPAHRTG